MFKNSKQIKNSVKTTIDKLRTDNGRQIIKTDLQSGNNFKNMPIF